MTDPNQPPMAETNGATKPETSKDKIVLAQVHVIDGVYNYHFKYNNPTEIMITIAMLEKMKSELLENAFPAPEVPEPAVVPEPPMPPA